MDRLLALKQVSVNQQSTSCIYNNKKLQKRFLARRHQVIDLSKCTGVPSDLGKLRKWWAHLECVLATATKDGFVGQGRKHKDAMGKAQQSQFVHIYMKGDTKLGTHLPISPTPMTATLVFSEVLEECTAEDAVTLLLQRAVAA